MKIFAYCGLLSFLLIPSCLPVVKEGASEKRLATIEKSIGKLQMENRQETKKTRHLIAKLAIRQDLFKKGLCRTQTKLKNDRKVINEMGQYVDEDAARIEDTTCAINKIVSAIEQTRASMARMQRHLMRLYQRHHELEALLPAKPAQLKPAENKSKAEPPGPPMDPKKKKKTFESVV